MKAKIRKTHNLFRMLEEEYAGEHIFDQSIGLAVYEKICWALSKKIFPDSKKNNDSGCILRKDGCIYENLTDEYDILQTGELITHEGIMGSLLSNTLFTYYNDSPFWDVFMVNASIDNMDLMMLGYEDVEDSVYDISDLQDNDSYDFVELMEQLFFYKDSCFFERASLDVMDAKNASPLDYFTVGENEASDECVALRSFLLPHYLKIDKSRIHKEHLPLVAIVEHMISVLSDLFGTGSVRILEPELEASYFVCFSGITNASFCFPYGTYALKKEVLLAGMLLDEALLSLNTHYHFLPEAVLKRRVEVEKGKEKIAS